VEKRHKIFAINMLLVVRERQRGVHLTFERGDDCVNKVTDGNVLLQLSCLILFFWSIHSNWSSFGSLRAKTEDSERTIGKGDHQGEQLRK
jgi:hypothetical protein